jgi:hypothetical protein
LPLSHALRESAASGLSWNQLHTCEVSISAPSALDVR